MPDILDQASDLEQLRLELALKHAEAKRKEEESPSERYLRLLSKFQGSEEQKRDSLERIKTMLQIPFECECGEPIPEGRRDLLKTNCVECQARLEASRR